MAKKSKGRRVRLAQGRIGGKVFYISPYGHQGRAYGQRSVTRGQAGIKEIIKQKQCQVDQQ